MKIILIRHGEAVKNLRDCHGGAGTELTRQGQFQNRIAAKKATEIYDGKPIVVFYSGRQHIIETANFLSSFWAVSMVMDNRVAPLYLGVLDGLSRAEAIQQYPEAALSLERWRRHEGNIDKITIPESELFNEFLNRVNSFLKESYLSYNENCICVVGSRSVLMMFINLTKHSPQCLPGCYEHLSIPNGFVGLYDYEL